MRRHAFIGIITLAVSLLTFANAPPALAQAGSVGGTIGKQDKSISGGEEDRPRAAPPPKPSAAKTQEGASSRSCNRIVGTWSWYPSINDSVFHKDGTALHPSSGTTGRWSCASGNTVNVVWSYQGTSRTDHMTLSQDGNSIFVDSPYGGGIKFTGTRR
jgi:hypothetical protein